MVAVTDARKNLFTSLLKQYILAASPVAVHVLVDARNFARFVGLAMWPTPALQVPANTLSEFSYEDIVIVLKDWQENLEFVQVGVAANPKDPGYLFYCGLKVIAYHMAGVVVEMYATGKIAELAELHDQLEVYVTREKGNKVLYSMPNLLVEMFTRILLDVVWLNSHPEGSNCIKVENHVYISTAYQTTSFIFNVPSNLESIPAVVMQHPILFLDEIRSKGELNDDMPLARNKSGPRTVYC